MKLTSFTFNTYDYGKHNEEAAKNTKNYIYRNVIN